MTIFGLKIDYFRILVFRYSRVISLDWIYFILIILSLILNFTFALGFDIFCFIISLNYFWFNPFDFYCCLFLIFWFFGNACWGFFFTFKIWINSIVLALTWTLALRVVLYAKERERRRRNKVINFKFIS